MKQCEQEKDRLDKKEWAVEPVDIGTARALVVEFHYAKGASNTATYLHGLFRVSDSFFGRRCYGVAWWIPPTRSAAEATYPADWKGVLSLSRLVIAPDVPPNACSFLIAKSRKMIDRTRWPCLVTYADTWRGHSGAIYKADNWQYVGLTKKEQTFTLNGVMVSRKAGNRTKTRQEMAELGAVKVGAFARHKFVHIINPKPSK